MQFIKNRKEFTYTIHDIKSSEVFAFQKINEYFYFIDNNKEVNRFQLDQRGYKAEKFKIFDFIPENKNDIDFYSKII